MPLKMRNINRAVPSKLILYSEHLKATTKRIEILSVFQKARTALCAEDIQCELLNISSSSLYRILETLERKKLIAKSNPPDDYIIKMNKRDRTFYILK